MPDAGYFAAFLIGLLGGTHCVGMCGGLVAALTVNLPGAVKRIWPIHLAYNLGRISSYSLFGAVLGAIGATGFLLNRLLPVQMAFYVLANALLVLLGLYLVGITRPLAPIEGLGNSLWRWIRPFGARFVPARSAAAAFPLGLVWGFVPCGLVYSILATALVSGSAARGGMLMLAFGLGTLPNLMVAGLFAARIRNWLQRGWIRGLAGLIVIGFGVFGLANASTLGGKLWQGVVCHV
ncbi:sulfite exporter TauE/SafE family protein [Niveibacterium sp. 24ML]|uniref:sulfite exporter TauE/SafE family protein n=1 Tax=Niveibacterium sp. 24ML TaxID=2985512 RepID=UPI0022704AB8|nr:sulfite exporter TauE/SafE family protein [Niveibacterium sp. 24ML]MCX9157032.1 sulfite exporter TauE/SafE family protein [Niveibacterium sp. 24ML]